MMLLRGGQWGVRVADAVRQRGGTPTICPLLDTVFANDPELRQAAARWNRGVYDWVVLTSVNAVHAVVEAGVAATSGGGKRPRVAAVGPATAEAARAAGIIVDVTPSEDFSTHGLLTALGVSLDGVDGRRSGDASPRVLLPLSNLSDDRLESWFRTRGFEADRVTAYETVEGAQDAGSRAAFAVALRECDLVLVTSGSAARALAAALTATATEHGMAQPALAAIGEPTAAALATVNLSPQLVAETHTIDGLLDASADYLRAASAVSGRTDSLFSQPTQK
jgi:uroporphyrinogen-III synthase